jgi:hypothetical protein
MAEKDKFAEKETGTPLPVPWQRIQTAMWLIGLAIIAWRDWWWPGILVLVAVSGLTQGLIQLYLSRMQQTELQAAEMKKLELERGAWLPSLCPNCGGPISISTVNWTGPNTADCPYCKANLQKPA